MHGLDVVLNRMSILVFPVDVKIYSLLFSVCNSLLHEFWLNFFFSFKDYNNIGKFLNRILGMEVHQQNALFQYFSDTLSAVVQNAKKNGRYDMGILGK